MACSPRPRTAAFTSEQIELGLFLLIAHAYSARIEVGSPQVDPVIQGVLGKVLGKNGLGDAQVAQACAAIQAARKAVEGGWCPSVSAGRIDEARKELLAQWGVESSKGALIWPPASRTIAVRLGQGSWADALAAFSIPVSNLGRQRGSGRFGPEEIRRAIRHYLDSLDEGKGVASFAGYSQWAEEARARGDVQIPSPATVRQRYGTWAKALGDVEVECVVKNGV
ncbi:hypothetical protein [Schaalia vaccimaxillae]|uniref:hypothetical protein n=1 Tax=Schaalia vaccimaxillae TaxID=183916 RepID=UPI0003B4410A|nr:hypothetical protein [Schaalia vaccimaxillae]